MEQLEQHEATINKLVSEGVPRCIAERAIAAATKGVCAGTRAPLTYDGDLTFEGCYKPICGHDTQDFGFCRPEIVACPKCGEGKWFLEFVTILRARPHPAVDIYLEELNPDM